MKLLGIGDNILDHYDWLNVYFPGGNSVNVPVLAHRFNQSQPGYIGVVGDDMLGNAFLNALVDEQVDISRVRVLHAPSACNHIKLDASGDRLFVGNNGLNTAQNLAFLNLTHDDYRMIEQWDLAHTSIHSWLDSYHCALSRRIPLSMDFSGEYNRMNIAQICPLLRFAFFSGGDKSEEDVRSLAHSALQSGARTVVVTMGTRGSYLLEENRAHRQLAYPTDVLDTLGAGDAFIAAFLAEYHDTCGDLIQSADRASRFAAQNCTSYGAFGHPIAPIPPDYRHLQNDT